jgi:intein/homing endonuclease
MIKKFKIPVGELFSFFGILGIENDDAVAINRDLKIKNQHGEFNQINYLVKKEGKVNTYKLEDDITIKCDEKHLVKSNGEFKHIHIVQEVDTVYGTKKVLEVIPDGVKSVYDFSLDAPHEYITSNGVICHNTTLARLIVNSVDCDYMIINASDENNVDTVRNKVKSFASTIGFKPFKIIVLDECLDENTLVTVLRDGEEKKIPIKNLNEQTDLVKSYNADIDQIQWRPFYLWDKGEHPVYEIELENGEVVVCTEDHKWYVQDEFGKVIVVKAKELDKYNHILSPQN